MVTGARERRQRSATQTRRPDRPTPEWRASLRRFSVGMRFSRVELRGCRVSLAGSRLPIAVFMLSYVRSGRAGRVAPTIPMIGSRVRVGRSIGSSRRCELIDERSLRIERVSRKVTINTGPMRLGVAWSSDRRRRGAVDCASRRDRRFSSMDRCFELAAQSLRASESTTRRLGFDEAP